MSSNLRIQKADYSTPQLKRGLEQQEAAKSSSKAVSQLLIQSRVQRFPTDSRERRDNYLLSQLSRGFMQRETSRIVPGSSLELPIQSRVKQQHSAFPPLSTIPSKHRSQEETSTKDGSACNYSNFSEQQQENASADVKEVNETFKNMIAHNMKAVSERRDRMGYNHTYEERVLAGEIWVGEPRDIPKKVFEEKQAQENLTNGEVNCLQGFISELGLFYYCIGNKLLFFDAENIRQESVEISNTSIGTHVLTGLLGIQVFTLGQPYFRTNKNVMILLLPYTGEMYDYSLKTDLQNSRKILTLRSRESFPLPQQRPSKLVQSSKGFLYCADDKGGVFKIDFNQSFWQLQKRQLTSKQLQATALAAFRNTTKYLTQSLKVFAKCVRNYTFSFFSTKPFEVQMQFDEIKEIIVVLVKEQGKRSSENHLVQYFLVYDEKTMQLLYKLKDDECSVYDDEIIIFRKLQNHSNTKYNFILLLKSGKRVLLEVHNDRLRKSTIIKPPPSNTGDSSIKPQDQPMGSPYDSLFFLKENLMGMIIATNYHYVVLARPGYIQTEDVNYVRVESGQSCSIYYRANDPLGPRKRCLLGQQGTNDQGNLPQFSSQVFYRPQVLYYTTDQAIQKIKILRPIDIFYSLFHFYSQNIPKFFKAIGQSLPETDTIALIGFCCQLLIDAEGSYLLSKEFEQRMGIRKSGEQNNSWSINELETHTFKDIDRRSRQRLMGLMVDIAINAGKIDKEEKQRFVVEGSLTYYSRLLKTIFLTNINQLTSQLCKTMSCILQQFRKFLQELQGYLKCDLKSYLGKTMRWANRFWQLMILCKDIPNLPDLSLDEALTQDPECFDRFIFQFLIKECKEEVFNQIKRLMPSFITARFTNVYRVYCEIAPIKETSKVLEICKRYDRLPEYFITYLVKSKGIPEANLLKDVDSPQKQLQAIVTYQEKMKDFYSKHTTLIEKQQILLQAMIIIQQTPSEQNLRDYFQARTLMGQLKLQQLIIESYHHRLINKSLWVKVLLCIVPDPQSKAEQFEVMEKLNTCLLDPALLGEVIENLNDPLLKVMYAYYHTPKSFERLFFALAENLFEQSQGSVANLSKAFQQQIYFIIRKAKLVLQFQDIMLIIEAYITYLTNCKDIKGLLSSSTTLLQPKSFWPLSYSAQIGIDPQKLYKWGVGKLQEYTEEKLAYFRLCLAYFVRDFLSTKRKQLIRILQCDQSSEIMLKHISLILL